MGGRARTLVRVRATGNGVSMPLTLLGWVFTGLLLVLVVTCIAASRGAIPLNHYFGVRLPVLMRSNAAWRAGHAAGGVPAAIAFVVALMCSCHLSVDVTGQGCRSSSPVPGRPALAPSPRVRPTQVGSAVMTCRAFVVICLALLSASVVPGQESPDLGWSPPPGRVLGSAHRVP